MPLLQSPVVHKVNAVTNRLLLSCGLRSFLFQRDGHSVQRHLHLTDDQIETQTSLIIGNVIRTRALDS